MKSSAEPTRPKTHCELHRDSVQTTSPEGYPIPGAFVPQCDDNGQYTAQQCHGSTGHCWCVDGTGKEKPGTRTPPGAAPVDCYKPGETVRTIHQMMMVVIICNAKCKAHTEQLILFKIKFWLAVISIIHDVPQTSL
uniref:Thyroglobulin type-1 domain-containing protein n=1 Tax=Mastacembelus armatus TaxID=205130 RepID=A0A7N8WXI5_9TELE